GPRVRIGHMLDRSHLLLRVPLNRSATTSFCSDLPMPVTCLRAALMVSVWTGVWGFSGVAAAQTTQSPVTQVDEVVVTASTREQSVAQAPATISVVTAEQLQNRAVADLTDAIRDVEGVSISGGSNHQDILIRGLPGHYTLILVD